MIHALQLSAHGDAGLYLWTGIIIAVIMAIAIPLTIHEQKVVKRRWQSVSEYIEKYKAELRIRPLPLKQSGDVVVPAFSGFLIHGNFTYICLDPAQGREKLLSFIDGLKAICTSNNSWHFDFFTNRFYMWLYCRKAVRAFKIPTNSAGPPTTSYTVGGG
jgi:hypothetical protein